MNEPILFDSQPIRDRRVAISITKLRGFVSHFAHFACEFIIPLYSWLKRVGLLESVAVGELLHVELPSSVPRVKLGTLSRIAKEIFPGIDFEYVRQFSVAPAVIESPQWFNPPPEVADFCRYLQHHFVPTPSPYGVLIIKRLSGKCAGVGNRFRARTGADRRTIGGGFDALVEAVQSVRSDCHVVSFEDYSFREQLAFAMSADTLVGQHGAGFAHAHWMPVGGQLIELQCQGALLSPGYIHALARMRNHSVNVIQYPCLRNRNRSIAMSIDVPRSVAELIKPRRD